MNNNDKKITAKELQKALACKKEHSAKIFPDSVIKCEEYINSYKAFLNSCKTEKECVAYGIKEAKVHGYVEFDPNAQYKAGDKVFYNNRNRALICATIGKKPLDAGARIAAAHIDSPRIDLKAYPLFEDEEICYLKSHFYGGIKNYQWVAIPLAMHGTIINDAGETITLSIGENESDPVFYITDLLPHLAQDQEKRELRHGIKGEELNIVLGTLPYHCEGDDTVEDLDDIVKLNILNYLKEKYDISEKCFRSAEIQIVPALKARDVGFDRSLVAGYGHDDRVCAYAILSSQFSNVAPEYTTVCVLSDKEEIGSVGNTGLSSRFFVDFMEYLAEMQDVNPKTMFRNTKGITADVTAGFDPTFPDAFDKRNASHINKGLVMVKFVGGEGKGDGSEASMEYMQALGDLFDKKGILWQAEDFGTTNDGGGGGTDTNNIVFYNMDIIDMAIPVISMHSPYEIISKLDAYHFHNAMDAFYGDSSSLSEI